MTAGDGAKVEVDEVDPPGVAERGSGALKGIVPATGSFGGFRVPCSPLGLPVDCECGFKKVSKSVEGSTGGSPFASRGRRAGRPAFFDSTDSPSAGTSRSSRCATP